MGQGPGRQLSVALSLVVAGNAMLNVVQQWTVLHFQLMARHPAGIMSLYTIKSLSGCCLLCRMGSRQSKYLTAHYLKGTATPAGSEQCRLQVGRSWG